MLSIKIECPSVTGHEKKQPQHYNIALTECGLKYLNVSCKVCCVFLCFVLLSFINANEVWAQAGGVIPTGVEPPSFITVMTKMIPMFAIVFAIFYMLVISPQKKEIEDQKKLLASLKKGDNVATSGGLLGRVSAIADDYITIMLEQNATVRVERHHITKKL